MHHALAVGKTVVTCARSEPLLCPCVLRSSGRQNPRRGRKDVTAACLRSVDGERLE